MHRPAETESVSPRYRGLDVWPPASVVQALFESQQAGIAAVHTALPAIEAAALAAALRLVSTGRLIYVGAGTSGRIAVQDGAELAPTFGWPVERTVLLMAGGEAALSTGIEGAEDDAEAGRDLAASLGIGAQDVVVGVAASGGTPYTHACVTAARQRGALTIGIANVPDSALLAAAEHAVLLATGPEVIAGSTRLKAGTAQKATLNLFSTLLMIRLGRTHDGLMVDMTPTNAKLRRRALRMVQDLTGCDAAIGERALADCGQHIKSAVLVVRGMQPAAARALLARHGGHLRAALAEASA